jgi:GT2 family glycosyltransferase
MNGVVERVLAPQPAPAPADLPDRRSVSVVMVVYMTGEALFESVDHALAEPLVDELVIVDNGSTAADLQALERLAAEDARVVLLSGHGNIGFARGANLGAAKARGEALVFLNPDAFLQPGCVAELLSEIETQPIPAVVGGRVLNPDRTEQRGARRGEITPLRALMTLTRMSRRLPGCERFDVHWEREAPPQGPIAVPTVSGACMMLRREDFDALKGFDEGYFLHVEDVDLCWRARRQGGAVVFHPRAEVIHLGHTSQTSPLKVEFHKGVGLARYFRKRAVGFAGHLGAWLLSPLVVGAAIARPLVWRLTGRA